VDPLANPYTPNAGARPQAVVGRDDQLASFEVLLARLQRGRTEQSMIITGLRGVGKTVLLGQFRAKALQANWVVVELEASKHDDLAFRRALGMNLRTALYQLSPRATWGQRLQRAASALRSFTVSVDQQGSWSASIDIDPVEGLADHGDLALDLVDVLTTLGEAAQSHTRGVVLLIDEIQFLSRTQLEALITAMHKSVQRELPITMVGAGLPQIAQLVGEAKSYAERLFKFPVIGTLSDSDAREALLRPAADEGVTFTDRALTIAVEVTGGYPYFLQELGYAVWGVTSGESIGGVDVERAVPIYESKLDSSFFRVRLDRTTALQRAYLRAMAQLGPQPQRASDVAELMGRTSPQIAPTRAELVSMGLLYTPEHGYASFTVPHFDRFMLRAVPVLVVPEPRRRASAEPSEGAV
jgi:hypothetical protein